MEIIKSRISLSKEIPLWLRQHWVQESVEFLIENLSDKGMIYAAFSGGKDSICMAELLKISGLPHTLYYAFTGIDPPEMVRFIRRNYPQCVFLRPKKTFWQQLMVAAPPSRRLRWCCYLLKKEPGFNIPLRWRTLGIRGEESRDRAKYGQINHYKTKYADMMLHYPIYKWTWLVVWEFIQALKLPYPSLYDGEFDRIGCVVCPNHSSRGALVHEKYRDRWPGYFNVWEKTVSNLYYKRVEQGKRMHYGHPKGYLDAWYEDSMARWYAKEEK